MTAMSLAAQHLSTQRAALLPESLELEFTIVFTTALVLLLVVVPVVVMVKDLRSGTPDPGHATHPHQAETEREAA